jgi:hypothetical protein
MVPEERQSLAAESTSRRPRTVAYALEGLDATLPLVLCGSEPAAYGVLKSGVRRAGSETAAACGVATALACSVLPASQETGVGWRVEAIERALPDAAIRRS